MYKLEGMSVELLNKNHHRESFDCGNVYLNRYFKEQAGQEAKKKLAATFVLSTNSPNSIVGYYTLSSFSIKAEDLPLALSKKFPRYPLLPATLIGRLAVNQVFHGKGYGGFLLIDALKRALVSAEQIGSIAVLVDAKDDKAKAFYQHFQFIPFVDASHKLFLPIATIQHYF